MKNKGLIATIVILVAVIITLIAVVFLMQMPSIVSGDNFANLFINNKKETTIVSTTEIVETTKETETETTTIPKPKRTTKIENFSGYKDHVSIDYPQIEGMDDLELQAKINEKIKTNAISIVPLYPISTALQTLTIACEVKSFDEDNITIIYTGRVIGKTNRGNTSNGSSNNYNNNSNGKDPYLDGFVDPLAGFNQFNINNFNIMPTSAITYTQENTTARVEIQSAGDNSKINRSGTADGGPTVKTITHPTAAAHSTSNRVYEDNTASNNPKYQENATSVGNSNVNSAPSYYSNYGNNSPVYGYTNVSTVDQQIFYTNTINLKTGLDMTLSDYVSDLDKLSRWTRSSKVEFANISDKDRKKVREYVNLTVQSRYLDQMKNADFRNKGLSSWPKIFSYRDKDGTVYFSVKLSSKLGNYAIVKYKP